MGEGEDEGESPGQDEILVNYSIRVTYEKSFLCFQDRKKEK
jgi:hypothetical protein